MVSSASVRESYAQQSGIDWAELAGFDRIVGAFDVGGNRIVLELTDGRAIRITAWRDLSTDKYVSHYERMATIRNGGQELRVWAHTPVYRQCHAEDIMSCLEAAALEVDRKHVY